MSRNRYACTLNSFNALCVLGGFIDYGLVSKVFQYAKKTFKRFLMYIRPRVFPLNEINCVFTKKSCLEPDRSFNFYVNIISRKEKVVENIKDDKLCEYPFEKTIPRKRRKYIVNHIEVQTDFNPIYDGKCVCETSRSNNLMALDLNRSSDEQLGNTVQGKDSIDFTQEIILSDPKDDQFELQINNSDDSSLKVLENASHSSCVEPFFSINTYALDWSLHNNIENHVIKLDTNSIMAVEFQKNQICEEKGSKLIDIINTLPEFCNKNKTLQSPHSFFQKIGSENSDQDLTNSKTDPYDSIHNKENVINRCSMSLNDECQVFKDLNSYSDNPKHCGINPDCLDFKNILNTPFKTFDGHLNSSPDHKDYKKAPKEPSTAIQKKGFSLGIIKHYKKRR
jgi:hypothetical protein